MAPSTFSEKNGGSYVRKQPETESERMEALRALLSCPTASIGTEDRTDLKEAKKRFLPKSKQTYMIAVITQKILSERFRISYLEKAEISS